MSAVRSKVTGDVRRTHGPMISGVLGWAGKP
jgi:hypothetical protein